MTGRSGKFSSVPRAALRIATLAAFMLLTRSSRSRHARDTYTRRLEGVSLWVVPSAEIVASDPDEAGRAVRAGGKQDLPPPDLLRHPGRGEAHLMAPSLPPIGRGRSRERPAARACDVDLPRASAIRRIATICCALATTRWCWASGSANGAGTGRCSRSTSALPISRSIWSGRRRCCSTRRATATGSPSTATCSTSAIACWSSSRTATSRRRSRGTCSTRRGSTCCCSG